MCNKEKPLAERLVGRQVRDTMFPHIEGKVVAFTSPFLCPDCPGETEPEQRVILEIPRVPSGREVLMSAMFGAPLMQTQSVVYHPENLEVLD
jgi:hypothetical protein